MSLLGRPRAPAIFYSARMSEPTRAPVVEGFTLGPFATNCYLVRVPPLRECWLIDAGFEPAEMIARVRQLDLSVVAIILTHAHVDHVAGLAEAKHAFPDTPVLIHSAEAAWPADPALNLSAAYGVPIAAPGPDRLLEGGETLTLGESTWSVRHTPGHSPGGITLHHAPRAGAGVAIVGDTLFAGSIGRFDLPGGDEQALYRSIRQALYTLPEDTRVFPGHGPATTIGAEKATNPYVRV